MTATPQLMLSRKWYQASKLEMEFHMIDILYAALSIHAQTEETTLSCKDDCTLTKHGAGHIPLCGIFHLCLCTPREAFVFHMVSNESAKKSFFFSPNNSYNNLMKRIYLFALKKGKYFAAIFWTPCKKQNGLLECKDTDKNPNIERKKWQFLGQYASSWHLIKILLSKLMQIGAKNWA